MRLCSECGVDMDLVGLRHRCVPRVVTKPVTKPLPVTKPNRGGRPRLGEGGDECGGADAADEGEAEEPVTRGQLFVRLPVPVRIPELSDAMRSQSPCSAPAPTAAQRWARCGKS